MQLTTETRCLGVQQAPMGDIPCAKRETCARYVQRFQGERLAHWLCPTQENFYGKYIEQEATP